MDSPSIIVVSANIGGMDSIKTIPKQTIEHDTAFFTDKNLPFPLHNLDNRLKAKYFKIMAHKLFRQDIIVWVDSNVQIKSSTWLEELIEPLKDSDISIARHPNRDCVYKEAQFIIDGIKNGNKYLSTRYDADVIKKEVDFYFEQGLPDISGLYWCGCFARLNNWKVNKMFEDWWIDNLTWSSFDQNSFVYEVKEYDINIGIINWGDFYNNNTYELTNHLKVQ